MTHIGICRTNASGGWVELSYDHGALQVLSATTASLQAVMAGPLASLKANPNADLSFSDRTIAEVLKHPIVQQPEDLSAPMGAVQMTIFCPVNGEDVSLWSRVFRDERGRLSSVGKAGNFRISLLGEQVERWFISEDWRSWAPPGYGESWDPALRVHRPPFVRELLVRHDWRARELCPEAFPAPLTPEQIAKRDEIQRIYEDRKNSKNPRIARQRLQEQWAAERAALKASPEERAAFENDRKIAAGAAWEGPYETGE